MVNVWHKTRRSVERDYKFYDSPRVVYGKITSRMWHYSKDNQERLGLRDLAFMCLMYGSTCRSSELCRYDKRNKDGVLLFSKHSVDKSQFTIEDDLLKFREAIILKRSEPVLDENGKQMYHSKNPTYKKTKVPVIDEKQNWVHDDKGDPQYRTINEVATDENGAPVYHGSKPMYKTIEDLSKYPTRKEITLPLTGAFNIFTNPIIEYLDTLESEQELFPFKYRRGWQIVNTVTGEMQHYLRDMGLKFYSRLLDRNLKDLQEFSGHARIQNLMVYLGEGNLEKKIKEVKF